MKKAYLVTASLMTRIVVDANLDPEKDYEQFVEAARDNIRIQLADLGENIEWIDEDEEMPYGTLGGENENK